jgi:AhpD family alkylhydroperoxidase
MGEQPDRMDLHEFRASRKRKTDNLLKEDHRDLKRFFALDSAAYRDLTAQGGLDEKTKELLGLVASTVLRCNDCIAYHCDRCVEVGWRKSELLDALNVALVVGGSITIPHIRTVWEVVEQLYDEKAEKAEAPKRAAKLDHAAHELKTGTQERNPSTAALTAGLTPAAAAPPPAATKGRPAKRAK